LAIPRASARTRHLAGRVVAERENDSRGFLGRWAQRKTQVLQGKPVSEPQAVAKPAAADAASAAPAEPPAAAPVAPLPAAAQPAPPEPLLSLEDTRLLTKDSDFKPFMASGVGSAVRNAAMKKLFADPHFNVMDGLDIYIDDYSIADPIPEAMLRQMNGAKFLNLFDDADDVGKTDAAPASRENANNPTDQTVAQSYESADIAHTEPASPENSSQTESAHAVPDRGASQEDHADTDLRLQPDYAAPAQDAGRGTQ
jgi:hypothetical protein